MKIQQIYTHSPLKNYSYMVTSDCGKETICIDPYDCEPVRQAAKEGNLVRIVNTHEHHDHIDGNARLKQLTGARVTAHQGLREKMLGVDEGLSGGDILKLVDGSSLRVWECPGHTPYHLCFLAADGQGKPFAIFTGDTVFNAGVGNCRSGDVGDLFTTVTTKISTLEDHIVLYPGHDYIANNLGFTLSLVPDNQHAAELLERCQGREPTGCLTTIGEERKINLFFALNNSKVVSALRREFPDGNFSSDRDVFFGLRKLRDKW